MPATTIPATFGRMVAFHGQMGMFTRALAYILSHGADGLKQVAEDAVLNANYILRSLEDVLDAPFASSGPCMHEAIFSDKGFAGGFSTIDLAKALIDEGFHPMTMYFPLVVHGAMLVEPTETESKAEPRPVHHGGALDRASGRRPATRASRRRRSTRRGGGSTRRWRRGSRCWPIATRSRRRRPSERRAALLRSARGGGCAPLGAGRAAQPRADRRGAARLAAGSAAWCSRSRAGRGEHAVFFAERFPDLEWQPSDVHPDALASIAAWRATAGAAQSPRAARDRRFGDATGRSSSADAVLSINMVHISPWASALGLARRRGAGPRAGSVR